VDNRNKVWYTPVAELKKDKISWKKLFALEDDVYSFFATNKEIFFLTPKNAPRFQVKKFAIQNPDLSKATVVVPEFADRSIQQLNLSKDGLYFTTTKNGVTANLYRVPFATAKVEEIQLPIAAGSAYVSTRGIMFPDIWVSMGGWTQDGKRYRFNPESKEFKVETLSSEATYPEYADLVAEEVMVKSHDGVEVPLSIVYNKNLKKDGNAPVLILGYGAYGISINPFFSPSFLLWTSKGGVLAIAHIRGGGELGDEWHKAGQKTTKPNTWKDLIACAEYLVANQYTSPKKIAINGGSAGGILIGRAITERPDLFAAAIPEVGCLNPLRAEESPNGPVNVPEFGTVKDSAEFAALVEMDSYLHVKDGTEYPATLVTAGINDPRVIAWQPGKFAARLTAANKSTRPILFLTDFEAGHGIGDTKTKQFESLSDMFSFALWQTGHPDFQISTDPVRKSDPESEVKVTQ
jgi:prolyl oligopeptidase